MEDTESNNCDFFWGKEQLVSNKHGETQMTQFINEEKSPFGLCGWCVFSYFLILRVDFFLFQNMHRSMNEKGKACSVVGMFPMISYSYFGVQLCCCRLLGVHCACS